MYDSLLSLQDLVTKSAGFDGTGIDLRTGTPRRGEKTRVIVPSASQQGGNGVVTFKMQHSTDNTTYTDLSISDPITLSATAVSKEIFIPFETSNRYVRLSFTNTISTGTAAVAYQGEIGTARPG